MDAPITPGIHRAMVAIMAAGPSVAKGRKNEQQNYQFRGIDDLYLECQPLLAAHGVHVAPHRVVEDSMFERQSLKGGTIIHVRQRVEFRFWHVDGSFISVETTGEAMDYGGDKASNKAMSAAMKYCLIQALCVPTDEPIDTEIHSPEAGSAAPPTKAPRPSAPQRPPVAPPQAPPARLTVDLPSSAASPPEAPVNVLKKAPGSKMWALTGTSPRLTANQQARVKILQKELRIEDKVWREKLFDAWGKTSSTELSAVEADELIARLEASKRAQVPATT